MINKLLLLARKRLGALSLHLFSLKAAAWNLENNRLKKKLLKQADEKRPKMLWTSRFIDTRQGFSPCV